MIGYSTLHIHIEALYGDRYRAVVRGLEEGRSEFELRFDEEELDSLAGAVSRARAKRGRTEADGTARAQEFGRELFDLIFTQDARDVLRDSMAKARQEDRGLRFMLHVDGAGQLRNVPWELLWRAPGFVSMSAYTPIVRYAKAPSQTQPLSLSAPLRILGMVSSPGDMPALDTKGEQAALAERCSALIERGLLQIDWVDKATLSGLLDHLNEGEYHIFHFIGHGDFDEHEQEGVLLLEGKAGQSQRLTGAELGAILADQHRLRLAVINACEGARMAMDSSGVAASLIQYNLPAVIAMQFEISDSAAICFAQHFYGSIARGHPIDKALMDARRGMFAKEQGLEWATPVLFTTVDDGTLFEIDFDGLGPPDGDTCNEPHPLGDDPLGDDLLEDDLLEDDPLGRCQEKDEAGPDKPGKGGPGTGSGGQWWSRWAIWAASAGLLVVVVAVLLLAGVFSGGSQSRVGTPISIGESPVGLAIGAGRVWVTSSNVQRLSWIAPPATQIAGHIKVGRDPNSVRVEPNGYVWVALLDENKVKAIEPRLGRVLSSYPVGREPNTLAIGLGSVWVANSGDGTVSRIYPRSGTVHTVFGIGAHPTGIAVGEGSVWVASSADRTIARINPRSDTVTQRIPVGRSTQAIAVGAGAVWVTNSLEGTVTKIDPRSNRVVKAIAVGRAPKGIAIASNGIWVANSGDGTVSQIDPASDKAVGKAIAVGGQPSAIAAAPGQVWVANLEESTVIPIKP